MKSILSEFSTSGQQSEYKKFIIGTNIPWLIGSVTLDNEVLCNVGLAIINLLRDILSVIEFVKITYNL